MPAETSFPLWRVRLRRRPLLAAGGLVVAGLPLSACAGRPRLSAAQIAVLKQQGFAPEGDDWQLSLANKMLFDLDSDRLKPATAEAVEQTGRALRSVDIRNIRVEGHTDNTGTDAHNDELSLRRARMVARAMDAQGIAGIQAVGRGKQAPVADNATEEGRAQNRRVVVIVPDDQS